MEPIGACNTHLAQFLRELEGLSEVVGDLHPTGDRRATTVGQVTFQAARVENARQALYKCLECWTAYHRLVNDGDAVTRPLSIGSP
jgi:hypothetical protein